MDINWESEIADLLGQLSGTQQELLDLLDRKRQALVNRDHDGLTKLATEQQELSENLHACLVRRQELLAHAEAAGLPADSIESLAEALPEKQTVALEGTLEQSKERSRLLRHQSISQWVATQRTLLHLSQMLEIIATGGRGQSTYGKGDTSVSSGRLMDQAV